MTYLYHTFFYEPLYNGLVFLLHALPGWADVGMAIIVFTVIVKLILYPLSKASLKSQIRMREIQPRVDEVKKKHIDPGQQSMAVMQLYKEAGINPFSGFFLLLIQIPIIIALYRIFLVGGLPNINMDLLYSFIQAPASVDMHFFGIDIAKKSIVLALAAAVSQYFQIKFSIPEIKKDPNAAPSFGNDIARMMSVQMKYILPIVVFVAAYTVNAGIAIYWTTSNLFMIGQELYVRRSIKK